MNNNMTIFDILYQQYKITKPIRMIELFGGYGSQSLAMKYLGANYESYKLCEWAIKSIQAYKDIHFTDDNTDYSKELTKEQIITYLYNTGISSNWNEPMKLEHIKRLKENELRTIFNNIKATHNLVNIQKAHAQDFEIIDKDKYEYIMTYSFPCQDLSLAGKRAGMDKDSNTRSGMLWEVERILDELKEVNSLPQILLMENVIQVHGAGNEDNFNEWQLALEKLGYHNYWQDLIATNYGIPQTRNRCFMISILGDYSYTFPKPTPLKLKLKDLLEDNVDEKYFLSDKQINDIQNWNAYEKPLEHIDEEISGTITTRSGDYTSSMKLISIKNATKKGYLEATDGDGIDISSRMEYHRGTVQKNKSQTISTMGGENNSVVVKDNIETKVIGGIGDKKSNNNTQWYQQDRIYDNNVSIAVTTSFNPNYIDNNLRIRKLTPKECFRLMGVKDEDYERIAKNQSDSSLYHLAGDSIVVNVLMAIFKELL